MALISKNQKDFSADLKDTNEHGENLVFIKGGSVIVDNKWVVISSFQVDVAQMIIQYVQGTSRRIFNNYNDILYVLIVLNKIKQLEILPSITYNKKSFGDVKIFDNLSGKVPLILVKLQQDGSSDLKAFKAITKNDIEVYNGYGNFTLQGNKGEEGYKGITGIYGETGMAGITGYQGITGGAGCTGLVSLSIQGITGMQGAEADPLPAFLLDRGY
jgi:hypothetical protein